jgi:ABC-type Na+ efflux pump permease subunit
LSRNRLTVATRELASLRSEKTIVLALLIQLFIAAFSSFLVVGLVSLYDPGATEGSYTVDVGVAGNASEEVSPVVAAGDNREARTYPSRTAALQAFERGTVDALLIANGSASGRTSVEAIAPDGDFRTTLVVVQLKDALADLERDRRVALAHRLDRRPLDVPSRVNANPYFGFTYTILVPLLAFLPAFISGSVAADSLAEELERGTLELLRVAPLSLAEIVDGKALAMVALAPAQAALWFGFLTLNGTPVANPLLVLVIVAAVTAVLVGGGALLALWAGRRREAQLVYSFGALAFFGGATLLPENPPNAVAKLAVGSATVETYGFAAGTALAGVLVYAALRAAVGRVDLA